MPDVFAVPVFFVVFRETLEAGIIISVLLSFLKQTLGGPDEDPKIYKTLVRQVWIGSLAGLFICIVMGAAFIGAFYAAGKNSWESAESVWEGVFCVLASVIITIMGAAILRLSKMKAKWQAKITSAIEEKRTKSVGAFSKKYAMVILPFITVLREGLEAVIFVGGVSIAEPASAFPLPVITALAAGSLLSYLIYKGGNTMKIQWFLIASTMVLYLVAAGLFSRGVWEFEMHKFKKLVGGDVGETGTGPGSYDIRNSVWHVNCCSAGAGGWSVFTALLGWQNSATYGSVISYNVYWIVVSTYFLVVLFQEKKGRYPFMKAPPSPSSPDQVSEPGSGGLTKGAVGDEKTEVV